MDEVEELWKFEEIMKIERIMKLQEKYRLITQRVLNLNANPYTGSRKILYSFHWSKFTKRSSSSHKIQRLQIDFGLLLRGLVGPSTRSPFDRRRRGC